MKWEKTHSSFMMKSISNLLKVSLMLISYRTPSLPPFPACATSYSSGSVRQTIAKSAPVFKVLCAGSVIPFMIGCMVRKFEEKAEFTGRDGWLDNPRQDLFKMGHYTFHTGVMATISWVGWKISSSLPDDVRVATLLGGIYFYALGRQYIMDPAESHLTFRVRYMPAVCISLMAVSRTPDLQKYLKTSSTLMVLATALHMIGFN